MLVPSDPVPSSFFVIAVHSTPNTCNMENPLFVEEHRLPRGHVPRNHVMCSSECYTSIHPATAVRVSAPSDELGPGVPAT